MKKKSKWKKKSSEGLVLKELPKHLKYVFMEEEKFKPIIIATNLTATKEQKVVKILRKHKEVIALSVEDLKGISPLVCMHKLLMEENARPRLSIREG